MTPTAELLIMFFQTLDARRQSVWTVRQLSAAIDKCERSVRSAARQLADAGEIRLTDSGAVITPPTAVPVPAPTGSAPSVEPPIDCVCESSIVEFVPPVEPASDQLSLFDDVPAAVEPSRLTFQPIVQAACREKETPKKQPVPACSNLVQDVNKPCTKRDKTTDSDDFAAALSRLSNALDIKRARPDAPAGVPMKENNNKIFKSMNYESPMIKNYDAATTNEKSDNSEFRIPNSELNPAPRRRRDVAIYNYFLNDIKRRFPGWHKPIFNPATNQTGNCKWAIETLANIMAYGAPECVYYETVDYCFSRSSSVNNPAAAFLAIVANLKREYQWRSAESV